MRSPTPSCRSDLRAYQGQLVDIKNGMAGAPDPYNDLAIGIVDRWIENADAEKIWSVLKPHLPADTAPHDFAAEVINWRWTAERLSQIVSKGPEIEKKILSRAKRHLSKPDAGALAALSAESGALSRHKELRQRLLGRQSSAPRTWFMREWTNNFKKLCGQPLDDVVRFITEIAFDDAAVTVDAVRGAQRPTSRIARRAKGHRDTRDQK